MSTLALHLDILWPAMLAGLLVLATHVPLGREVLQRGIIFLDLAIAQTAAFGVILANTLGFDEQTAHHVHAHAHAEHTTPSILHGLLSSTSVAVMAAVTGSLMLYAIRQQALRVQEAMIGILFVLMATGSVLLLSADPHGGEKLKEALSGQILWLNAQDLLPLCIVYAATSIVWFLGRNTAHREWLFYPLFAVTITLSTQVIGVYLVFASLIIPSVATLNHAHPLIKAYLLGLSGYVIGLVLSASLDFPAGASTVWSPALVAGLYTLYLRYAHNRPPAVHTLPKR